VVPGAVLDALGHGAYNFHPGPPDYPGWAPAHFALYDGATTFGATAHVMARQVDSGPIVGVEPFVIPGGVDVRGLEQLAFVRLARLFWRMARDIAREAGPLPPLPISWSGTRSTRRMYADMCRIPGDVEASELARRIRAFHDDFRGIPLTVSLHGVRFQLAVVGARAASRTPTKPQEALPSEATVQHPLHPKTISELAVVVAPGLDPERSCDHPAVGEVTE
jgi:methionyl-tRNA formyltransferase